MSIIDTVTRIEGTRIDHYELLGFLGDGAQAEVYRAKDLRDGSEVVIKFPRARNLDHPVLVARWRREAAITDGLDHPRIVCRRDGGERHSEPFIVLEYADCGTLRGFMGAPDDPLPVAQALAWGRQLAEALVFLHGEGIVHQDLKPENILVNSDLTIKLGDFGAAIATRPQNGQGTQRRRPILSLPVPPEGTAGYLSPEQIVGQASDPRSDIYSWGVVTYELLTGRLPFVAPAPNNSADVEVPTAAIAVITAQLRDQPLPVRTLRSEVSPALEAVVMTAMRRLREHRYPSVDVLLADLGRLDSLDPATFDLTPEDPITAPIGGAELPALLRLIVFTMVGFLSLAATAIAVTAILR